MRYLFIIALSIGCASVKEGVTADQIIRQSVSAYGLDSLNGKEITFAFRSKSYSLIRTPDSYTYTRSFQDSLGLVQDVLVNSTDFERYINGEIFAVDKEWADKYASSINSVLYFLQLPFTLMDPAVIKSYQGKVVINGKFYHQIEVRFAPEDGGKDFEDVFLYWFDVQNFMMDYLAYSYLTDGGGARFREAINRKPVGGITFQDYINYKPEEKDTPLMDMLDLYEEGALIELSRIENENVLVNEN